LDGEASEGERLVNGVFDALLYHLTFCHVALARPLHTVWQSFAAHELCVPELIRSVLALTCSRVSIGVEDTGK
jgi:hypothetical protein